MIKKLLIDYSEKTSIQGINYVANAKLTLIERIWWAIIVVVSILCCGTLICNVYRRHDESPVIISFENEPTSVYQIPFPAVTVCPQVASKNVAQMHRLLRVDNMSLYDFDEDDRGAVVAMAQLCDPVLFSTVDPLNKTNCDTCKEVLKTMMASKQSVMMICRYNKFEDQQNCANVFREVITEDGVCYTFNGLDVYRDHKDQDGEKGDEWTLKEGYDGTTESQDVYPRPGSRFPLILAIAVYKSMANTICKGPIEGYKIYLHLPSEVPQVSKHFFLIPFKQAVKLSITPKMITTKAELRELSVEKRQCYFSDERYLRFFKYYTRSNCEMECEANLTLSICGCLRFHMPKTHGVKLCGISDINCYQKVVEQGVEMNINKLSGCYCLPACTEITFDTEISQNQRKDIDRPEYELLNIAEFAVVFRDSQFVALKRSLLFGKTELLANCGGLLGLFLGFSVLSSLELVYFCTIRLIGNFTMDNIETNEPYPLCTQVMKVMNLQLKNVWRSIKTVGSDYLQHSTIHGFNHLVEKKRAWFEKVWWFLVIGGSFFCCGQLINDAWNVNPIIISFAEKPTPIWQVPFPAVTICPKIFAKSTHINLGNLLDRLHRGELTWKSLSEPEQLQITALTSFCSQRILATQLLNITTCNNCLETLRQIKIPPSELFHECKFQNVVLNCTAIFKEQVNEFALCYTFNGFEIYRNNDETASQEWSIDEGYAPSVGINAYPRRALAAGEKFSLSLVLRMEKRDVNLECFALPGFWLMFRMPYDVPTISSNFYEAYLEKSAKFVIKPVKVDTVDGLRSYPVESRKCYFSNERRLKYFRQYTQSNCEAECEVDYVLAYCGCLKMFIELRTNQDICGPQRNPCVTYYRLELSRLNYSPCQCLPGCSMLSFESEIFTTTLNISRDQDQSNWLYSEVNIYFKESHFMASQRSELYSATDLLANSGGLMGLCLGVSVISLFEIIYFCTIP